MLKELRTNVQTAMLSHIPCVAIDSSEPADQIIRNIVKVAAETRTETDNRARAVYVWRQADGFSQMVAFEGDLLIDHPVPTGNVELTVKALTEWQIGQHKDATFSQEAENGRIQSNVQQRGANVPFALEVMESYDARLEGRGAIFVLRDWHLYMSESGKDLLDRQLSLFEKIMTEGSRITVVILSPFGWNSTDETGKPRLAPELAPFVYTLTCPMPDTQERRQIITSMQQQVMRSDYADPCLQDSVETLTSATGGLTRHQLQDLLVMSVTSSAENRFDVGYILKEKNELIKKGGFLMGRPPDGFDSIGGLSPLKDFLIPLRKR